MPDVDEPAADPDTEAMLAGAEVEHGGDEYAGQHEPRTHAPDLPPTDRPLAQQ